IVACTSHLVSPCFVLSPDSSSPFADYRFLHPETRWYNIASRVGMRAHFRRNADAILDFFAGLVCLRLRQGHRPLLVAKKCFVPLCAERLVRLFPKLGMPDICLVTGDWEAVDLQAPRVVPLINYGMIGTNLFEAFSAAYCLSGYYVNERVVNTVLQDVLASDNQIPIRITTESMPRRRRAGVLLPSHRLYDIHRLAQLALDQQEMDGVLQAVGRVRPYTKPREIITFHCGEHPHFPYTREFHNIGEARQFFGIFS